MDKKRFRDRHYLVWHLTVTLGDLMTKVHLVSNDDIHALIHEVKSVISAVEQERIERNKELTY